MNNQKHSTSQTNESLSHSLLEQLSHLGKILDVKQGSYILKTGESNDSLFILISGELNVIVENEVVATLDQKGDLAGEMSIISQSKCVADVVAKVPCTILKVPVSELAHLSSDQNLLIYKIFCLTLCQKIERTNQKAKNFELLSRDLEMQVEKRTLELKAKNSELTLGYKKLENLHTENVFMVNNIAKLDDVYLKSALKSIEQLGNDKQLEGIKGSLQLMQKSLAPIKELRSIQESLAGQKVLVIESNVKQRSMIKIALGGTGVRVELAKTIEEAKELLSQSSYSISFLSVEMIEMADYIKQNNIKTKIVLSTNDESKDYLFKVKDYDFVSNIIATRADDRAFNIKSVSTTVGKMTSKDIFGLEKYLNWGVNVREFDICDSNERGDIANKVLESLSELGVRSVLRSKCHVVIEELLMNAIYDAPTGPDGKPIHNHKNRSERVTLSQEQKGKLRFATDGLYLAVSVEDPFGVFKKETILKYLEKNYSSENAQEIGDSAKGGAGKGIFMITENSDLVIYNVSPMVKTEVIVLFDLDSTKEKKSTSLHYFEL